MTIDRIGPSRRPEGSPSGMQSWRDLLFVHWPFAAAELRPLIPAALDLDAHEGTYYVGAVPFIMRHVRPRWVPRALAFNFLETNLRTYVHYRGRPGVYFFSLEAASWLAVKAARLGWGLPYFYAQMDVARQGNEITYRTQRGRAHLHTRYRIGEPLGPSQPGSLQHFLLERYLLFNEHRGRLRVGQVHHVPYPVFAAQVHELNESLLAAAGLTSPGAPTLAHFSPGVDVEVFGPHAV